MTRVAGRAGRQRKVAMAERADRYELYETAVHDAEAEVNFMLKAFRELRRRRPLTLREDFSGPASAACEWVRRGPQCRAIAVDIESEALDWGRLHRLSRLSPAARRRVTLINADVLRVKTESVDVIAALNFSYWVFRERRLLLRYFRRVRQGLTTDGLLILDAFGGYEAYQEMQEQTRQRHFTYVWDQARYHPVTGAIECHIHFRFPDGSRINRAFTYQWRLWTIPELRELLTEAGFREVTVYWEGHKRNGSGNGVFTPETLGEADAGWVAYLVAEK